MASFKVIDDLINEKVVVYEENSKFDSILQKYYDTRDNSYVTEMWPIVLRCSANILKKRFGHFWSSQEILDNALDMSSLLISRITNKDKYPNGYIIKNLPTMLNFTILNVVHNHQRQFDEKSVSTFTDIQKPEVDTEVTDYISYNDWLMEEHN